ncbi:unnamed protein product [Cutaneotrichosporon oleaginosum]
MVKREHDDSDDYTPDARTPEAGEYEPERSPSPVPKKAKVKKEPKARKTARANGGTSSGGSGSKTMWDAERSASLVEAVFEAAGKAMDMDAVASKLGVNKSQVVDQLKNGRSNIRRMAIELVRAKKGGAS